MSSDNSRQPSADLELAAIRKFAKEAIVACDLDGIVTSWNPAAERLFGYSSDEVLGRDIDLIVPPGDRANEREILLRVRRGERTEDYETQRIDRDGRLVHVSITFLPIKDEIGHTIAFLPPTMPSSARISMVWSRAGTRAQSGSLATPSRK